MYSRENEIQKVVLWFLSNSATIDHIIQEIATEYNNVIATEPSEFYQDILDESKRKFISRVSEEIARNTGVASDIIIELLEEDSDLLPRNRN